MLRHKTMIQGARIAFGFAGIYDEDEADRIMETNREAIEVEGVVVETEKQDAPQQTKAETLAGAIKKKIKRETVKEVTGEPEEEVKPDVKETKPDITARGKAALKGKITKCKDLESLEVLKDACMEFHGSDWFDDLTAALTAKKAELENG